MEVQFIIGDDSKHITRNSIKKQQDTNYIIRNADSKIEKQHSGWTVFLTENETIPSNFINLLNTRYATFDVVICRTMIKNTVFPSIGTDDVTGNERYAFKSALLFNNNSLEQEKILLKQLIRQHNNYIVTDEVMCFLNACHPTTMFDLVVSLAKKEHLSTFCTLLRRGVSLLISQYIKRNIMKPCEEYWVDALRNANIKVTPIFDLDSVVEGTTLLAYANVLDLFFPPLKLKKKWPVIIMNTEPRSVVLTKKYVENLEISDLVLEYDNTEPGLFFPHMCFSKKYNTDSKHTKKRTSKTALLIGIRASVRNNALTYLSKNKIDAKIVSNLDTSQAISTLSMVGAPMLIPRTKESLIEFHRISSIAAANRRAVALYKNLSEKHTPILVLLSNVISFSKTEDNFAKKIKKMFELHDDAYVKKWWDEQDLHNIIKNILRVDPHSKITNTTNKYIGTKKYGFELSSFKDKMKAKAKAKAKAKMKSKARMKPVLKLKQIPKQIPKTKVLETKQRKQKLESKKHKEKLQRTKTLREKTLREKTLREKTLREKTLRVKTLRVKTLREKTLRVKTLRVGELRATRRLIKS